MESYQLSVRIPAQLNDLLVLCLTATGMEKSQFVVEVLSRHARDTAQALMAEHEKSAREARAKLKL